MSIVKNYIPAIVTQMALATNDPLDFANRFAGEGLGNVQSELIKGLLYEIIRVKELIKKYEDIPNGEGNVSAAILTELVYEAYNSLVNYDIELIHKYYDLLHNCD